MARTLWGVMGVIAGLLAATGAAGAADGIAWRANLKEAMAEALKADRLVMAEFFDQDCSWCQRMDKETLSDGSVISLTEKVVPVRVDVGQSPDMARTYKLQGVPTFVFLEGDGAEAGRIEGFLPPDEFVKQVQQVLADEDKVVGLRKQVAAKPDDFGAKADLLRIYVQRRQPELGAPLLDALLTQPKEKAPKDLADMALGTAIGFGAKGDNDKALVYLAKVTANFPGTEQAEWAGFFTGLALGLKGDRDAAIKQLEQVRSTAKSSDVRERAEALLERFKNEPPVPTL